MVMKPEPVFEAVESVLEFHPLIPSRFPSIPALERQARLFPLLINPSGTRLHAARGGGIVRHERIALLWRPL